MHARCQNAGRRIRDFKFMIGQGMQRFLVDTSRMMSRDHRQHTRTAPTSWRRLPCKPVFARLVKKKNSDLLHAELKGRVESFNPSPAAALAATARNSAGS